MADNGSWNAFRMLAEGLEEKYPGTDLMSLGNDRLAGMLLSLEATEGFPEIPSDEFFFYCVKTAWLSVRSGEDGLPDDEYDAYI